ncbi:MAG: hypothetical protein ACRD4O_12615 [Bryobacteraceae bacterium]
MTVSGSAGFGADDATNNGSDNGSLAAAGRGTDQGSCGRAAPNNGGRPAIMAAAIIVASAVDGCGHVAGNMAAIAIAPKISAVIAISIFVPFTIIAVVDRLILHPSTAVNVVPPLRSHHRKSGARKRCDDGDRCELLNAFHNCLRP